MSAEDCILERIGDDHRLDDFECGTPALDTWLKKYALRNHRMDSSRVSVLVEDGQVVGYYALTMGAVHMKDAPPSLVRGLPAYDVGAVVLARFAVASQVQRRGYGERLLAHAVADSVAAGSAVAARLIVVDAIDEQAARYYRRFGFVDLPENPLRLYVRLADAAASIREADK